MTTAASETKPLRYFYGSDPSQFADLHLPAGPRRPGVVVLFHPGWWGPAYGADNLDAMAADLAGRGRVVWNVEYRRLELGGGYPETLDDAAAAIDFLATLRDIDRDIDIDIDSDLGIDTAIDTGRVVALGHSAGGLLATWAAGRGKLAASASGAGPVVEISGVISLAGVVDLGTAARERIGKGAAVAFMGGRPEEHPNRYAVADPLSHVPIPAVVRCIHALGDDRVPFAQSAAYVKAARSAGQDAQLIEVDGDHFTIADPRAASWPTVITVLEALTGAA